VIAPYAIVSFPFLFSLMFGDAGHGALLVLAAVAMVAFEKRLMKKKSKNEVTVVDFLTYFQCIYALGQAIRTAFCQCAEFVLQQKFTVGRLI